MARLEAGDKAPAFSLPDQDGKKVAPQGPEGQTGRRLLLPGRRHARVHEGGLPVQRQPGHLQPGRGDGWSASHRTARPSTSGSGRSTGSSSRSSPTPSTRSWRPTARGARRPCTGRRRSGVIRSTFLLDDKGVVARAWYNVRADGHAEKVLEEVRRRRAETRGPPRRVSAGARGTSRWSGPRPRLRESGAPSLGQSPPRRRAAMSSPVCDPPRRSSRCDGAPELAVETAQLVVVERVGAPPGSQTGPPQDLVADQVADAGQAGLVEEPCLQRARWRRGPRTARSCPRVTDAASGPSAVSSGSRKTRGQAPGVVQLERARRRRSRRRSGAIGPRGRSGQ